MKRKDNLYEQICSMDNLRLADALAQQEKKHKPAVKRHIQNAEADLFKLHCDLINKTLKPPVYKTFPVIERKERIVYSSSYYPNLIIDYAILNVIGPILDSTLTADTYACIKGRGVHKAATKIKKVLRNEEEARFCLKIDVKKFYPSVDHDILKYLLRRKFKDNDLLWLLDMIIDSAPGLPIGRYLSQHLSNFYLTGFDHWLKEKLKVAHYFRYVDDMAIPSSDKTYLHDLRRQIAKYLHDNLNLELKSNWRVFPVRICGLDMLGYVFFGDHTLMRKENKKNFARAVAKNKGIQSLSGHIGWAKHCDSIHLLKKLLPNEKVQRASN